MQLNKKWMLLIFFAAPLIFVPPNNGNSRGSDSTVVKSNTDSLEKAVIEFVKAVDKAEVKARVVEAKIIENEKKERKINRLVNRLIVKADKPKPKIVVKKVVQDTSKIPDIGIDKIPQNGNRFFGIKNFSTAFLKKKKDVE